MEVCDGEGVMEGQCWIGVTCGGEGEVRVWEVIMIRENWRTGVEGTKTLDR